MTNLLKRHQPTFTDAEIVEFSELFYAGKAGASMSVTDFIETLDQVASGDEEGFRRHPILDGNCSAEYIYRKSHDSYTQEDLDIKLTHRKPETLSDRAAFQAVKVVRGIFDTATGWSNEKIVTQEKILNRVIFLETVAAAFQYHFCWLPFSYHLDSFVRLYNFDLDLILPRHTFCVHCSTLLER